MSGRERFTAGRAALAAGGCVESPTQPPVIRGRPQLVGADSPAAPGRVPPPRDGFPLPARPAPGCEGADRKDWAAAARRLLDARLLETGAILLRGLPLGSPAEFSEFFHALGYEPMDYVGVATREQAAPGVFTTNVSKPEKTIMMHNEMAAEPVLPAHLFLFCDVAPPDGAGGETPIARNADWRGELGPELLARFEARGLIRRIRLPGREQATGAKLSWQQRYGSDDRGRVEAACRAAGDRPHWNGDGSLTLDRAVDALIEHAGEKLWFGTLPNARPVTSIDMHYADDGEPVETEILEGIRAAQWHISVAFSWQQGDVLCLDNRGSQHGRLSFAEGVERRIYVSIATPTPGVVRMPRAGR